MSCLVMTLLTAKQQECHTICLWPWASGPFDPAQSHQLNFINIAAPAWSLSVPGLAAHQAARLYGNVPVAHGMWLVNCGQEHSPGVPTALQRPSLRTLCTAELHIGGSVMHMRTCRGFTAASGRCICSHWVG